MVFKCRRPIQGLPIVLESWNLSIVFLLVHHFYRNKFLNSFCTLLMIPTLFCQLRLYPLYISKVHSLDLHYPISRHSVILQGTYNVFRWYPVTLLIFLASAAQWADVFRQQSTAPERSFSCHVSIWKAALSFRTFGSIFLGGQLLSSLEMFKLLQFFVRSSLITDIRWVPCIEWQYFPLLHCQVYL